MKKWILVGLAATAAMALAADRIATAVGGHNHEDGSVATINFELNAANPEASTLLFAADGGHHEYPDTIITSESFERVRISGRQVLAEGHALLLGQEDLWVELRAWDGAGTNQPDQFSIRATAEDGHVFEMSFELNVGDINIRNR